jgi:flagellar basal body rod protein FlgG
MVSVAMVNGLYTSGNAMMLGLRQQEITANNMANAQTPGFKISRLVSRDTVQTGRDVDNYMRQRELQSADEVHVDWSNGPLVQTGNPLDLALRGDGFLAISTPEGDRYLRTASLKTTDQGNLVDGTGSPVLDQSGQPIQLPSGKVAIGPDGQITVDGKPVATLKIVDFPKPYSLKQEGSGRWVPYAANAGDPVPESKPASANTAVETGSLEGPNVNTVAEMVRMISQFRDYEADSKVLHSVDTTLDHAVNEVGKV